ncbi:MAG: hypothetical protein WBI07_07890 [Mobilitalea sp.]
MRLSKYIALDKKYKSSLINTDIRNLGIGCVGMVLFCSFVLNWALHSMDHLIIFGVYLTCFTLAEAFYIYPLVMVYEEGYVPVFRKYKNLPIDKHLFFRSKFLLLIRFSILFYLPVQLLHFWGLERTNTPYISLTGFWPISAMALTLFVQYIYIRILARDFMN